MRDPYAILGVRRNAGPEEIKAAWRSLAKAVHPDQNQDDPLAVQRFAEAGRAYEILKNPQLRARYDDARRDANLRYMEQMQQRRRSASGNAQAAEPLVDEETAEDMVSRLFGADGRPRTATPGGGGRSQAAPAKEPAANRNSGAAESQPAAAAAAKPEARQDLPEEPPVSQPRGTAPAADLVSAIVRRIRSIAGRAQDKEIDKAPDLTFDLAVTVADIVNGTRVKATISDELSFSVRLPAGTRIGDEIRLKEQGYRLPGLKRGDAVATVRLSPDETIRVDGYDLRIVLPVDISDAILGAESSVETPMGTVAVTIPPWSGSDCVIRLENQGLADAEGKQGDLLVELRILLGPQPDNKVTDLMRSLREGLFL